MVFRYKEVIVSGTQEGVEGVSAALAEISTFMQDCGWNLVDDRSAQPGTNVDATHMKYVFSSNGENGEYPTYYMTLYSGSSAAVNNNLITFTASTAYDVGTHTTAASGVDTLAAAAIGTTVNGLNVRSQDDNTQIFMSGDSEMVHLITRREITNNSSSLTMDNTGFGRFNSFATVEENPYPLVIFGSSQATIVTTNGGTGIRGIGGQPPQAFSNNNEMEIISYPFTDNQQPYNLGDAESIFMAFPLLVNYDDPSPLRKGVAGTVRNGWKGSDGTRMLNLSILTASGSGGSQEYRAFTLATAATNTNSLIVRKS